MKRRTPTAGTILVAEDDSSQRLLLRHILSAQGYEVVEASDGHEALAKVCQGDPDLVITDFEMPRMDGLELVRTLRADPARGGLPILMLTAKSGDAARLAGLEAGVDDYLSKPFSRAEVTARVRNLLRLRHALRRVEEQNEDLREAVKAVRESQRRAIAAEKLACVGSLAMGLCHELNNPLAIVRTNLAVLGDYVEALLGGAGDGELATIAEDLPTLKTESFEACARLRSVTDQFANLQAVEQGPPRRLFALDSALRAAIGAATRRVRAEIDLAAPEAPVMTAGWAGELANCLSVILGRFAVLAGSKVSATLVPGRAAGDSPTLVLTGGGRGHRMDVAAFFDPAHVVSAGRVTYDFSLAFARDVLVNMGADIDVACAPERMQATIVFPAP